MERKTIEVLWPTDKEEPAIELGTKLRVAAYCRVSDITGDKISSLQNQISYYSNYILKNPDYRLVGVYYDSGISGITIDKRPGFKRLIRHCLEDKIDVVITKSISRFSRNTKDLLETVELLKENNVVVIFEKEKIDSSKTRNKFFLTALSAVYQQESLTTSEQVKWSSEKNNRMGKPIFRDQFGYRTIEIEGEKTFKIVEQEAEIIRQVYRLYLQGESTTKISNILTNNGFKTPSGKDIWSGSSVSNILVNVNYTGNRHTNEYVRLLMEKRYIKNEGQENRYYIKNTHPAIIDEDTFMEVQKIVESKKRNKKSNGENKKQKYPLSGRITCGHCGWIYYHSKKRSIHRWKCGLKSNHINLCSSLSLTEFKLIEMMKQALEIRYNLGMPGALKRMKEELERVNQNDMFELHRMSNLTKLILTKEKMTIAKVCEQEELSQKVKELESEILSFEDMATKIEEDRVYRIDSLEMLKNVDTLDDFLNIADVSTLRAWVMELTILNEEVFQVRWIDNSITEIGDYIVCKYKRNIEPSKLKRQKAGIEVVDGIKLDTDLPLKEYKRSLVRSDDSMEAIDIQNKKPMQVINYIKNKYNDSSSDILKIEPVRTNKRIRVGVYARVSTREPDQLGSLESQVAYYTFAILKDPNNKLVRVYSDEGVSGIHAEKRTGFQKMIKDCKNGKIDRIITKSISRFARNSASS